MSMQTKTDVICHGILTKKQTWGFIHGRFCFRTFWSIHSYMYESFIQIYSYIMLNEINKHLLIQDSGYYTSKYAYVSIPSATQTTKTALQMKATSTTMRAIRPFAGESAVDSQHITTHPSCFSTTKPRVSWSCPGCPHEERYHRCFQRIDCMHPNKAWTFRRSHKGPRLPDSLFNGGWRRLPNLKSASVLEFGLYERWCQFV